MLKRIGLLAPCALIVVAGACGGESLSTTAQDQQVTPQAEIHGGGGRGGGVGGGEVRGGVGGDVRGGEIGGVEGRGGEGRGGEFHGEGRGGEFHGGEGRGRVHHHGWVNGKWAPGWGWSNGAWVEGGTGQYSCVTDDDCVGPLGPDVAICDFDETIGLGECVATDW